MAAIVELVILLGAIAMAIQSVGYLATPVVTSAGILPLIVSVAAAAVAAMLLVIELIQGNISVARFQACWRSEEFRQKAAKATLWLTMATVYALITPFVGFAWATLAFLGISLTVFSRLSWWRTVVVTVAMATIIPIMFRHLFFTVVP